ncbi:probable cytochrome P450 313a4 [Sabethes cyaneus]|uniref:probable cytochrome P450 313a4 n=1 Tax=Sabethes cyaneus TaxID=53552 RepID=UPI00237D945E|nr:probable cytochrome P450 313a4 [Sabethes cyaneus]
MWNAVILYLITTVVAIAAYYRWSRRKVFAAVANMSGPPALPLIGHMYLLAELTTAEAIYHKLKTVAATYTSPLCIHLGPLLHIVLYNPEHLQIVLNSPHCLSKPLQYQFFRVNKGLFSAPVSIWKGHRKILNLSFGPAILNSFIGIFNEKSVVLVELMEKYIGQEERDFSHDIALCTLDAIYSTAFGCNFDMQRAPDGKIYLELQEEFIDIVTTRVFSPTRYSEFIYRMTKAYRREQEILREARLIATKVMKARNADELLSANVEPKLSEIDGKKPQIFLDKLLELARENYQLSKEDIPEHLDTIIFAGNDTTATTMSNLLLMLAMHPDIQERVYQEVMQACPDKNQYVSADDVTKLVYTEMVCKETMRLFPVAPIVGRTASSDIKLDDHSTIPSNATILCGLYQLHRDPQIWGSDAEVFNPDNFLPENCAQRHPYAYLPFSGGPRNCIGIRYAWLSMKVMIVHLLRKYRLKTSLTMNTLNIRYSIILKITNGCWIALEKRES